MPHQQICSFVPLRGAPISNEFESDALEVDNSDHDEFTQTIILMMKSDFM